MEKHGTPDTPWYVGYVKKEETDPRRHKSRCAFFYDGICYCGQYMLYSKECNGSSHCIHYSEEFFDESEKLREKHLVVKTIRDNHIKQKRYYKIMKYYYKRDPYYKICISEEESILVPYTKSITEQQIEKYINQYNKRYHPERLNKK